MPPCPVDGRSHPAASLCDVQGGGCTAAISSGSGCPGLDHEALWVTSRHLTSEVPDNLVPTNFLGVEIVTRDKARDTLGPSPIALRPKEGYMGSLCVCWL